MPREVGLYRQIRLGGTWTKTIGWLIGINVVLFVAQVVSHDKGPFDLTQLLGLIPGDVFPYRVYTLITYAFLHGGVSHLLFNMVTLFFFGGDLDLFLGRIRFLVLYFGSALTGGLASELFLRGNFSGRPTLVIGASGALYGLLAAYALYFPQTEVLLWFVVPMKIWVLVLIWVGVSLLFSIASPSAGGVAHLAHLGGAVFAFLYVKRVWRIGALVKELKYQWRRRRFRRIQ
jgi:membrane associated rhomboid family serine protease